MNTSKKKTKFKPAMPENETERNLGTVSNPSTASVDEKPKPETASGLTPEQEQRAAAAMRSVMEKISNLTNFGLGTYIEPGSSLAERKKNFDRDRAELLEAEYLLQFERCVCWLNHEIARTVKINQNYSSYGLKHIVERDIGYLTNGVFIAAAVHCGFRWREYADPNPCFNVSGHSIRAVIKRQDKDRELQRLYKDC